MKRLLLVDGHAYAYRAFYAIREMRAPDGRATNAIFGFIKMLDRARALVGPSHIAVIWDGGLDSDRVEALPAYKAQRPEMPGDLEAQLDPMADYLAAAGICSFCKEGVEADDVIGAVAVKAVSMEYAVTIATSDKDFMQLVADRVRLLNPGDKKQPIWDADKVVEKTGVQPSQIVDWLSLVGDAVDNIQGVPGVGPKTAAKLLSEHGSVDQLYAKLGAVEPERLRASLEAAREVVLRNRALVKLNLNVAGVPSVDDCARRPEDRDELRTLYECWGFRSMASAYAEKDASLELLL